MDTPPRTNHERSMMSTILPKRLVNSEKSNRFNVNNNNIHPDTVSSNVIATRDMSHVKQQLVTQTQTRRRTYNYNYTPTPTHTLTTLTISSRFLSRRL